MSDDEGRFASIDASQVDFTALLRTRLGILDILSKKYARSFRIPRLLFPTIQVDETGDVWRVFQNADRLADGDALVTVTLAQEGARDYLFNGATWDRARGGNLIAKSVDATAAGSTAVWTPTAGKKFRLIAFEVNLGDDASIGVAGVETIKLLDSATRIWGVQTQLGNAALTTNVTETHIMYLPPNGYLSAAANNVLNVNLGTVLATGVVSVNTWGLEE